GRFRSGAMRLAAEAGVPVVPVALIGTRRLLPVHGRPRRSPVVVRIGAPMLAATADQTRAAVAELLAAPAPAPDSKVRRRVVALADTRIALTLVGLWAFAEAVSWPLVPEFVLGLL